MTSADYPEVTILAMVMAERDEAREHRRRLFDALERIAGHDDLEELALLNELRPHVAKEGA